MNSVEYRQLCQLIKSMETSLSGKIDRFAKNMFDALKGLGIIDPDKDTMTTSEVCRHYGISERQLYDYRASGELPFIKTGNAKNSKIKYRIVDVIEFFALRNA